MRRAFTLAETLVVVALFGMFLAAVVVVQHSGLKANRKAEETDQNYRQALVAAAQLQATLSEARVRALTPAALDVDLPRRQGSTLLLQPDGTPQFDQGQLLLDGQKRLQIVRPGQSPRPLALLGREGTVAFSWVGGVTGLLQVDVKADDGPGPGFTEQIRIFLANQSRL